MKQVIESTKKKNGLIQGYEPNKISFYIILLNSNRLDELNECLWNDMQKYKIDNKSYVLLG